MQLNEAFVGNLTNRIGLSNPVRCYFRSDQSSVMSSSLFFPVGMFSNWGIDLILGPISVVLSPEEIEAFMVHEFGHYVLHHHPKAIYRVLAMSEKWPTRIREIVRGLAMRLRRQQTWSDEFDADMYAVSRHCAHHLATGLLVLEISWSAYCEIQFKGTIGGRKLTQAEAMRFNPKDLTLAYSFVQELFIADASIAEILLNDPSVGRNSLLESHPSSRDRIERLGLKWETESRRLCQHFSSRNRVQLCLPIDVGQFPLIVRVSETKSPTVK